MLSSQSTLQTLSRTGTPVGSFGSSKDSLVYNEKRQVPAKSIRRRTESLSASTKNNADTATSSRNGSDSTHHYHAPKEREQQQQDYRQIPPTSLMHWTKIKTVGKNKPKALRGHSMTLVDEKIFIFGGSDTETCYNDLYIFDTETYWWTLHKTKGMVPPPRPCRAHSANLIGDYIYVFGGGNGPTYFNTLYLLNTKTLCWEKPEVHGQIPSPRRAHTSWVYKGLLYIFAGGDGMCALNDIYVLSKEETTVNSNPNSINNSPAIKMTQLGVKPINAFTDINSINNSIDNSIDSNSFNDPKENYMYENNASKNTIHHSNSISYRNHMTRNEDDGITSNPRLRYVWTKITTTGKAPSPRGYHTSNLIKNDTGNKVIIFGGSDGHECFSELFILDLDENHWTRVDTDRPIPRLSHTATQVGSYLFIIGGHDGNRYSHSLILLNLVTLRWEVRKVYGERPSSRGYHSAILSDSRIFLYGGYDGHRVFSDMYVLDLSSSAYLPQITKFKIGGISD
ncbi:galactose oxidase [Neocallimastix californiae]|jgi:N-acetylneuraminic acid mutarotase|uniref:Galactose oxidase n=1 Tax=Neocallimastix californiae TaxID=1754190 RepID=A0A1Y2AGF4_9FUNG|nr:galactose oxidase [Neocallimastix californiae]|eukprot:ORY21631.1 galactose oxidase [Neocallimastix californiae]